MHESLKALAGGLWSEGKGVICLVKVISKTTC